MPAVDALQSGVVHRLDAVFHNDDSPSAQLLQIVECLLRHAVWACADDDAHHAVLRQRLLIAAAQRVEWGIGVAVCLEVGEVTHGRIFPCEEVLARLYLLPDALRRIAVRGIKRTVVAERASSCRHRSVAVGA